MRIVLSIGLILTLTFSAPATSVLQRSSVTLFKYRPERVEPGTVYHYLKSNIDGSRPAAVSVYVASRTHLEVLKIYPGVSYGFHVTADMDWTRFEADHLMQWALRKDGSRSLQLSAAMADSSAALLLRVGDRSIVSDSTALRTPISYHPTHVYSFDFTSLNFAFRHLADPEKPFEFGVIAAGAGNRLVYKGEAHVRFTGKEIRHNRDCRVYLIEGPAMDGTSGKIWVNKQLGHIEDMEIPLSDTPGWTTFKLELRSIQKMDDFRWNDWMVAQVRLIP